MPEHPKLYLICHGIMLFWYRPANKRKLPYEGYTILLPQAPESHSTDDAHELRLGLGVGADPSVLSFYMDPKPTEEFDLEFGFSKSDRPPKKKKGDLDLVLYRSADGGANPDIGDAKAGVAFAIDIPYPATESPIRAFKYKKQPYSKGKAQQLFKVKPKQLIAATSFSFDILDPNKPLGLRSKSSTTKFIPIYDKPITADLKLHLYMQPRKQPMHEEGHIAAMNRMLKLDDGTYMDLKPNPARDGKKDDPKRPDGLDDHDLEHLFEIKRRPGIIDPAECGQGGGC